MSARVLALFFCVVAVNAEVFLAPKANEALVSMRTVVAGANGPDVANEVAMESKWNQNVHVHDIFADAEEKDKKSEVTAEDETPANFNLLEQGHEEDASASVEGLFKSSVSQSDINHEEEASVKEGAAAVVKFDAAIAQSDEQYDAAVLQSDAQHTADSEADEKLFTGMSPSITKLYAKVKDLGKGSKFGASDAALDETASQATIDAFEKSVDAKIGEFEKVDNEKVDAVDKSTTLLEEEEEAEEEAEEGDEEDGAKEAAEEDDEAQAAAEREEARRGVVDDSQDDSNEDVPFMSLFQSNVGV